MQLVVNVLPLMAGTGEPVAEAQMIACPPDVEPDTILSFLTQRFGDYIELAWTTTEDGERLDVGWIFPAPLAMAHDQAVELACIPHVVTDDGSLESMFKLQHDQRRMFEQLAASGAFDRHTVVEQSHCEQHA